MKPEFLGKPNYPKDAARSFLTAGVAGGVTLGFMLFWLGAAPLATSLTVTGSMASSQPVVPLQTPIGGRLSSASLKLAQTVSAGEVLVQFDTRGLQGELAATEAMIDMRHVDLDLAPLFDGEAAHAAQTAQQLRLAAHEASLQKLDAEISAARSEANRLDAEIAPAERKASLVHEGLVRKSKLSAAGAIPESDLIAAETDSIDAAAEVRRLTSAFTAARDHQAMLAAQRHAMVSTFEAESAARKRDAQEQLAELKMRRERLLREIEASVLRAPLSGTVVIANAVSAGQVFAPGEVLAEIAGPIGPVEVDLLIPTRYIDQVSVGQSGVLVVSALPQRRMPRIHVVVTAVAGAIRHDAAGTPVGYAARGIIDTADMKAAKQALGTDFKLLRDMPVQVMLEGRPTTVLTYLTRPLVDMVHRGTEDG